MRIIYLLAALLLVVACSTVDQTQSSPDSAPVTYVRKNIYSPEAAADIEALKTANEIMRDLDCSNPLSWYYQGALHLTPPAVENNLLCPQFSSFPTDSLPGWGGCTHDMEETSRPHFLTWHRMYIWHYEKIVRKLSGKEDFALPYWEYTNASYRVMPEAFRDTSSSLYTAGRLDSLNMGIPITEAYNFHMDPTNIFECTTYEQFNPGLDDTPHGPMHGYIGGSKYDTPPMYNEIFQKDTIGVMGLLASAGFDPIFFVHHANIDYLWEIWNQSDNGKAPIRDSLLAVPWNYVFFDENGQQVNYTIDQVLDTIYNLDYKYDVLEEMTHAEVVAEVTPDVQLWSQEFFTDLNKDNNEYAISREKVESTFDRLDSLGENDRLLLQVRVSFEEEPNSTYYVFLNLDEETEQEKEERFAGGMSFFGAGEHLAMMSMSRMGKTFRYDITDELKDLDPNELRINIREIGGKRDENMTFESASLYIKSY